MKEKHKKVIRIQLKDKVYPIELDLTPHRHEDEDFDVYKERQKFNRHFLKMEVKENTFDSISYLDKVLGQKGRTAVKNEFGELVELIKEKENGESTIVDGNVADEGHDSDTTGSN